MTYSFDWRLGISLLGFLSLSACAHQPVPVISTPPTKVPSYVTNVWRPGPLMEPAPTQSQASGEAIREIPRQAQVSTTVYFPSNKATLNAAAKRRLNRLIKHFPPRETNAALRLQVTGFTEGQATAVLNRRLALQRARAVRDYLVDAGIDAERIQVQGRNDCCYDIATGSRDQRNADASDRRVDIRSTSSVRAAIAHFDAHQMRHGQLRLARYSTLNVGAAPIQARPLAVVVQADFPAPVQTLGNAIHLLLADSGYRMAKPTAAAPAAATLLALPLPDSQRTLGPLTLQAALTTLAGPAHRLVLDPVHRLVSFALAGTFHNDPSAGCAVVAPLPPESRPLSPCRPVRGAPACPSPDNTVLIRNLTVAYARRVYRLPDGHYCRPATPPATKAPQPPKAAS